MSLLDEISDIVGVPVFWGEKLAELPMDSLDYLDLILKLEAITGVDVPRDKMSSFVTVDDLIGFFQPCQKLTSQ